MRTSLRLALLSGLACAACGDDSPHYAGLSFDVQSAPPIPVSVESDRIELVAGLAVKVRVDPMSTKRDYTDDDVVVLHEDDADLFEVYATEDAREFVLVGLRSGDSCLRVNLNHRDRECIAVRILPAGE